jgi:hypothetical protein
MHEVVEHADATSVTRGLDRCLATARLQYSIAKYEVVEYADATSVMVNGMAGVMGKLLTQALVMRQRPE